jgi:hypothetical protein
MTHGDMKHRVAYESKRPKTRVVVKFGGALERLTNALEWDPFELPLREQDTLPEGVRTLLLAALVHIQHLTQTSIAWVQTLDAAMVRRASEAAPPMPAPWPMEERQPVRRGRPRKPKALSPDPDEDLGGF